MDTATPPQKPRDDGFTLVELLIVIVILGVLSTVTVFAVSGITSRGETAASAADAKTLQTAQEAYNAQNGTYASEADLVSGGFIKEQSSTWDVSLGAGNTSYELVAPGGGGGGPVTAEAIMFNGFTAEAFGNGATDIVFIGTDEGVNDWLDFVAGGVPVAGLRLIYITDLSVNTIALAAEASVGTPMTVIEGGMTTFADSNPLRPALQFQWGLPVQDDPGANYYDWDPLAGDDIAAFLTLWAAL